MYLETIDEKAFRSFLSNPAISVLDGNVLDKYNGSNFYRFVRVPLSDGGEHHVDAIFGNMYSTYDLALNAHRFSANGNLEFMAYLVDYKDTYNESYQFRTLFGGSISTEDGSFHSVRNGMTKALHEYLVKTTVLEPEYLEDPDRNKLAYVMAVGKYVYGEEDNKTEETFSGYFKRFDDTLTVEFLVNPSHWAESVVAELDKRTELYDGLNFSAGLLCSVLSSSTSNSLSPTRIAGKVNTRSSWMLFPAAKMCGLSSKGTASSSVFSTLCPA